MGRFRRNRHALLRKMARILLRLSTAYNAKTMNKFSGRRNRYWLMRDELAADVEHPCKCKESKGRGAAPSDVPKGHCAVYVGNQRQRFVIPTTLLHQQVFRQLLDSAEQEFGFDNPLGLVIPCDDDLFLRLTSAVLKD